MLKTLNSIRKLNKNKKKAIKNFPLLGRKETVTSPFLHQQFF